MPRTFKKKISKIDKPAIVEEISVQEVRAALSLFSFELFALVLLSPFSGLP